MCWPNLIFWPRLPLSPDRQGSGECAMLPACRETPVGAGGVANDALRAGGGLGEECGTTLPREQGMQGECGTMTLPLSA